MVPIKKFYMWTSFNLTFYNMLFMYSYIPYIQLFPSFLLLSSSTLIYLKETKSLSTSWKASALEFHFLDQRSSVFFFFVFPCQFYHYLRQQRWMVEFMWCRWRPLRWYVLWRSHKLEETKAEWKTSQDFLEKVSTHYIRRF